MIKYLVAFPLLALVAACGERPASEPSASMDLRTFDVKEETTEAMAAADASAGAAGEPATPGVPAAAPRIAYTYTLGYQLGSSEIGGVQAKHLALCEKLTTAKCRVKSMQREVSDGQFVNASLNLVVDAALAKQFQTDLDKTVEGAGGESTSRQIAAEDLSKQMVDTEARIKAKKALADRLMALLQNRSGKVGELVEAERAFAEAQEELEAARGWMAEMQARVAMSDIAITYNSSAPSGSGLLRPVRDAFGEIGQILGESIGALLRVLVGVLPWALLLWGVVWLIRRRGWFTGWRWRFWRRDGID